jgi:hypothetical protein
MRFTSSDSRLQRISGTKSYDEILDSIVNTFHLKCKVELNDHDILSLFTTALDKLKICVIKVKLSTNHTIFTRTILLISKLLA